jgi:uncharacterized protein (UPF0210 family)
MAGAYLGYGEPETVINVGVSGPGVVKKELEQAVHSGKRLTLGDLSETIKKTSFRVTRVGELIGREVGPLASVSVLSISPGTHACWGDSVGRFFVPGLESIEFGSTALALLNDAVKRGLASSSVAVIGTLFQSVRT